VPSGNYSIFIRFYFHEVIFVLLGGTAYCTAMLISFSILMQEIQSNVFLAEVYLLYSECFSHLIFLPTILLKGYAFHFQKNIAPKFLRNVGKTLRFYLYIKIKASRFSSRYLRIYLYEIPVLEVIFPQRPFVIYENG